MAKNNHAATRPCGICGRNLNERLLVPVDVIRPQIALHLDNMSQDWRHTGYICRDDMAEARRSYVEALLTKERGDLTDLDKSVVESLALHETVASNVEEKYDEHLPFGDRMADKVASFGGSWAFIISFSAIIVVWMAFNSIALLSRDQFDPYPYILLNLVLSCIAAFQAPVIMMSQRRQEEKDRMRSQNDYRINLKAELEIRHLHEKVDHLLLRQWERLAEIQQVQIELMQDIDRKGRT